MTQTGGPSQARRRFEDGVLTAAALLDLVGPVAPPPQRPNLTQAGAPVMSQTIDPSIVARPADADELLKQLSDNQDRLREAERQRASELGYQLRTEQVQEPPRERR